MVRSKAILAFAAEPQGVGQIECRNNDWTPSTHSGPARGHWRGGVSMRAFILCSLALLVLIAIPFTGLLGFWATMAESGGKN